MATIAIAFTVAAAVTTAVVVAVVIVAVLGVVAVIAATAAAAIALCLDEQAVSSQRGGEIAPCHGRCGCRADALEDERRYQKAYGCKEMLHVFHSAELQYLMPEPPRLNGH